MSDSSGRLPGVAVADRADLDPLVRLSARSPVSTRTLAGLCAVVPVALVTLYRVVHNAPGTLPRDVTTLATSALPVAAVGPAAAGLLLAASTEDPLVRVGLAFVGGFGVVAALSPAAWLPAAVGVTAGGVVVVASGATSSQRAGSGQRTLPTVALGGVLVAGVGVSLAATAGVAPASLRPLGSVVALGGVAATPLVAGYDRASLLAGAFVGLTTVGVATSAPYVAGAVLLVGGGVVGAPLGLVALAVGGGVTGLVAALDRGRTDAALGIGLLLAVGVPATLLGALAVVVAVALFAGSTPTGPTEQGGVQR